MKVNSTNIVEMVNWKEKEVEGESELGCWVEVAVAKQSQTVRK